MKIFIISIYTLFFSAWAFGAQVEFVNPQSFGKITVGTSKDVTFTIKNTSSKKVRMDSFWFNNSLDFKMIGGTCKFAGANLNSRATCTVIIRYTPAIAGLSKGSVSLGYFLGTTWNWGETTLPLSAEGIALVVTPTPTPTPTPAPTLSWLKVVGNQIQNSAGAQVILKGVNIADPEHLNTKTWERPNTTARSIASLATDQYFAQILRLPILPGNANYPNEGFFSTTNGWDNYFNKHIAPLVQELTEKGIYVIIDLHYISDYDMLYPEVEAFWKYMAPKFANNPYVFYEIFNEPINPNDWAVWKNTIAQPIVNIIRNLAPNNIIMVGGPNWSSNMAPASTNPIIGTNIVYIAHVYSNQTPSMWDSRYAALAGKFPLFISEWGFETGGTEGGDLNYGEQFESWMRFHNVGWTAWSFDTLWGPRMFNSDWTLKGGTGGEGVYIRDLLIEQRLKAAPLQ